MWGFWSEQMNRWQEILFGLLMLLLGLFLEDYIDRYRDRKRKNGQPRSH